MEGAVHSHCDFRVRRSVVHRTLNWLVTHNQYYRSNHVHINVNAELLLPVESASTEPPATKRGYVGMCNRRSVQQESGAALSKNSMFTAGSKIIYCYYTRCALIRDRQSMTLYVQLRQKQRVFGK